MRPIDANRLKETIKKLDVESSDIKTAGSLSRTAERRIKMADGDLISRASLLAATAELKESPWHNFGKVDGTSPEGVEAIWYYGYLQRKEAVEIIENLCIKKEPAKRGRWEYDHTIGGMKHYHCTNCKNSGNECIADENEILWWEFCPRCGARMDLMDGDSDDQTDR